MWYISVSHVTQSDRHCRSMKWLRCWDLVFLFGGLTGECRRGTGPHWSAIICMLNTPLAPWSWRESLARRCATAAMSRVPKLPCAQTHTGVHGHTPTHIHMPGEALSYGVLFHVFILGPLMRRVVSGVLSGPSDLSVVVQPSSPLDQQEKNWTAVVTLFAGPHHFFCQGFDWVDRLQLTT